MSSLKPQGPASASRWRRTQLLREFYFLVLMILLFTGLGGWVNYLLGFDVHRPAYEQRMLDLTQQLNARLQAIDRSAGGVDRAWLDRKSELSLWQIRFLLSS